MPGNGTFRQRQDRPTTDPNSTFLQKANGCFDVKTPPNKILKYYHVYPKNTFASVFSVRPC